jgi:hypothetical protein
MAQSALCRWSWQETKSIAFIYKNILTKTAGWRVHNELGQVEARKLRNGGKPLEYKGLQSKYSGISSEKSLHRTYKRT